MKTLIISYSLTGNNDALANGIAEQLSAEHIRVTEKKPRKNGTIFADLIFKRYPKVQPEPGDMKGYDIILFIGPVWIGETATPLRPYIERLKSNACRYAFVSISGGADGPNVKLPAELEKRTGRKPAALVDMHIADLLPMAKPTRKDTGVYRINDADIKKLTGAAVKAVREAV